MAAKTNIPVSDAQALQGWVPLREAARTWPGRGGRSLHVSVLYRWKSSGAAGVILRTARVPGVGFVTRHEWIAQFIRDVNERHRNCPAKTDPSARPTRIRRQHTDAVFVRHDILHPEAPQ